MFKEEGKYQVPHIVGYHRFIDNRGVFQVFDWPVEIKRVYQITNFSTDTVRGFHGHESEQKFIQVLRGAALVVVVNMVTKLVEQFVLSEYNTEMLFIPGGYYNGFKVLQSDSIIQAYSSLSTEESLKDDYRVAWDSFGTEIWEVHSR